MKAKTYISQLFIKKINSDKYLIYNSSQHIPAVFSKKGTFYVETIFRNDLDLSKSIKSIEPKEHAEFTGFYNELENNDFLNINDSQIKHQYNDEEIMQTKKTFYFFVTDRCNLNCDYCFNKNIRTNFNDLSLAKWKKIIDKIKEHIGTIVITGGEPTLFTPLYEFIEYIKKVTANDININMFTNGNTRFYGTKEKVFKKIINEINELTISCDNISDDNHRRVGFSREIFTKNIEWLKLNRFSDKVSLNSVYSRGNLENIKKVKSFANKNSIKFSFALSLPQKKSEKKFMPNLREYKDCLYNNVFKLNSDDDEIKIPVTLKCSAASTIFSIDSQGNCYPCQNFHFPEFYLGNLLENFFKEIYFSKPAKQLRNHTVYDVKICKDCNIKYVCGGGCVADTFKLHKSIKEYPDIMCPYYKVGAANRLLKNQYE